MTISIFSFQSEHNCVGKATLRNSPYEENALNDVDAETTVAPVGKFIKAAGRFDWKIFSKAIVRFCYLENFEF
jgi:hypothetical protein